MHERGRLGRLRGGLRDYLTTTWWGLVSPWLSEKRALVIVQAVILRDVSDAPGSCAGRASGRREVLLSIRSDLFGWELPGGTPEAGERAEQALRRELHEETGLHVEVVGHVGDWVRRGFRPHTARVFRCRVIEGEERTSHETPRLRWFDAEDPPEGLFPWYREPLAVALESRSTPVDGDDWQGLVTIWQAIKIDVGMRWRGLPPS